MLARLHDRVRTRGVGGTLAKLWRDRVFRRSTSVVVEYRPEWRSVAENRFSPDWLSFVTVGVGDPLPPLGEWLGRRRAGFEAMLDAGKVAVFAVVDGVAVACVWLSFDDHHDPVSREHYPVAPGEVYHYCWLVDPECRRRNVTHPLSRHVLNMLAARGIVRQFGVVDRENRASYVIQTRFGYRECGIKVMHYVVFGSRWTRILRYDGVLGPARARG